MILWPTGSPKEWKHTRMCPLISPFLEVWYLRVQAVGWTASPRSRVVHLRLVFGVRRRQLSVDGRREAAVVLVVVGQLQVQQAGAGGQVDVLHVIHRGATHRAQLKGKRARVSVGGSGGRQKQLPIEDAFTFRVWGNKVVLFFLRWWNSSMDRTKTR